VTRDLAPYRHVEWGNDLTPAQAIAGKLLKDSSLAREVFKILRAEYDPSRRCSVALTAAASAGSGRVQPIRQTNRQVPACSAFAGFRFPPGVVVLAVRWYLRFGLSYRDAEELLAERGIEVDHVSAHRWVRRFAPLLADAARFGRHRVGDRWHVDETYVKVAGRWVYLYRAVDQFVQVIDVYASTRRDSEAARRLFQRARTSTGVAPVEVVADRAPAYPRLLQQVLPAAWHHVEQYVNNQLDADRAQLRRRLRPMAGSRPCPGCG
jgi:transposase-like protein